MRLDLGAASDVGRVRDSNEDSMLVVAPVDGLVGAGQEVVVAVADGMGGHQAGEVASDLAVKALREAAEADGAKPVSSPEGRILRAMQQANRWVWEAARKNRDNEGMGTTLVCAVVNGGGQATIGNVGDSRAYLVSKGQARLVTVDHSWVTDQVRLGRMSTEEADRSPYRHILSRSLGVQPEVDVDVYSDIRLEMGDALVLCSDGVSEHLGAQDLPPLMDATRTAQEAAEGLVRLALERGGSDNATVVVVRVTA